MKRKVLDKSEQNTNTEKKVRHQGKEEIQKRQVNQNDKQIVNSK